MTLDKYNEANIGLREKFKSLDNKTFKNMACKEMAKLFLESHKLNRGGIVTNKFFENKKRKIDDKYYKWADEVDKINFIEDIEKGFNNINKKSFIDKTIVLNDKIVNFTGGYMNKPDEEGNFKYKLSIYNNPVDYEKQTNAKVDEFYIKSSSHNEELSNNTDKIYEIIK